MVMQYKDCDALSGSRSAFSTGIKEMKEQLQLTFFCRIDQRTWLQPITISLELKPPDF